MKIAGQLCRTIWPQADMTVGIIDQTVLPHRLVRLTLSNLAEAAHAIADMQVRGAPLIGVTAAYGLALALRARADDRAMELAIETLAATRPTAVNLRWALERLRAGLLPLAASARADAAWAMAADMAEEDVAVCSTIGDHGLALIEEIARAKSGGRVNILTHCNAGWLATVDWGTATAPIYKAYDKGIDLHVLVDETRPRNQGAALTAFELGHHGVSHDVIVDNAGGHYMQRGEIDIVIVGTDRTTRQGDVCNKIGTYLKALAAHDNGVPFYVAAPSSSIDFALRDGLTEIPIEERHAREVTHLTGETEGGTLATIRVTPQTSGARNPAFDVTPARLVSGLITERGMVGANEAALRSAFSDRL